MHNMAAPTSLPLLTTARTQKESMSKMGNIQASGYIARYFGSALGAIGGAVLYNEDTWGWGLSISTLFWINGLVPLVLVLPLMPCLVEMPKVKDSLSKHTDELWVLVQKKAVWRPMSFVYLYNVLMVRVGRTGLFCRCCCFSPSNVYIYLSKPAR